MAASIDDRIPEKPMRPGGISKLQAVLPLFSQSSVWFEFTWVSSTVLNPFLPPFLFLIRIPSAKAERLKRHSERTRMLFFIIRIKLLASPSGSDKRYACGHLAVFNSKYKKNTAHKIFLKNIKAHDFPNVESCDAKRKCHFNKR